MIVYCSFTHTNTTYRNGILSRSSFQLVNRYAVQCCDENPNAVFVRFAIHDYVARLAATHCRRLTVHDWMRDNLFARMHTAFIIIIIIVHIRGLLFTRSVCVTRFVRNDLFRSLARPLNRRSFCLFIFSNGILNAHQRFTQMTIGVAWLASAVDHFALLLLFFLAATTIRICIINQMEYTAGVWQYTASHTYITFVEFDFIRRVLFRVIVMCMTRY